MPKIHNVAQMEIEWLRLHIGRVTASELKHLVKQDFGMRTGEMPKTYLYRKLAEAYQGRPLAGFSTFSVEQGIELESEARGLYALEYSEQPVTLVGFVEHDNGRCGCSPDMLVGDDGGGEIKCPEPQTHVKYLCQGVLPEEYVAQVHHSLYVTGRAWWDFMSYRRGFPAFVLKVERDEAIIAKIETALNRFYGEFDKAMTALRAMEL